MAIDTIEQLELYWGDRVVVSAPILGYALGDSEMYVFKNGSVYTINKSTNMVSNDRYEFDNLNRPLEYKGVKIKWYYY
jgi:hypothetical protein